MFNYSYRYFLTDAYASLYLYLNNVSPWPAWVDDVSSVEWDADLLVVVDEVVLTVVVSEPAVQTTKMSAPCPDRRVCSILGITLTYLDVVSLFWTWTMISPKNHVFTRRQTSNIHHLLVCNKSTSFARSLDIGPYRDHVHVFSSHTVQIIVQSQLNSTLRLLYRWQTATEDMTRKKNKITYNNYNVNNVDFSGPGEMSR